MWTSQLICAFIFLFILNSVTELSSSRFLATNRQKIGDAACPKQPRKPLNAYMLFWKDTRSQLLQQNPGLDTVALAKQASELWKNLDAQQRGVRSYDTNPIIICITSKHAISVKSNFIENKTFPFLRLLEKVYVERAKEAAQNYPAILQNFEASLTEAQREARNRSSTEKTLKQTKKKLNALEKQLEKPSSPTTSFNLFVSENIKGRKIAVSGLLGKNF